MRSRKDRKPKGKKSAPVSDDDEPSTPVPKEAPQADIDDEWPEDDVKPKKGKKAKKDKKGGKKDLDEDEDMDGSAVLDVPAQPAEAPQADIDDEWPEDDVKPKKGKKGKKAKGGKKADEEDEEDE
jgi:translation initiation factor 5B